VMRDAERQHNQSAKSQSNYAAIPDNGDTNG
jgi:hypothetical protein